MMAWIDPQHFERNLDVEFPQDSFLIHAKRTRVRKWEIRVIKISLSFHSSAWTSSLGQGCPKVLVRGPRLLLWAGWPASCVNLTNVVPSLLHYCVVCTGCIICKCCLGPRIGHPFPKEKRVKLHTSIISPPDSVMGELNITVSLPLGKEMLVCIWQEASESVRTGLVVVAKKK
jgi:hypothetical protein